MKEKMVDYYTLPYTIELIPEEKGGYHVRIKELIGCMSYGKTPNKAVKNIQEAKELWLDTAIDMELDIPRPEVEK